MSNLPPDDDQNSVTGQTQDGTGDGATVVYTDGACSGNPGPGGWAWATTDGRTDSGGDETTTNQRMELQAVLEALQTFDGPVIIYSDSTYVVNCFNDRWFEGWLKRDWKNTQRKPVANRDIWEPLIEIYLEREHELEFIWVKGHSGDEMNDLVDALAVAESTKLKEELGGVASTAPDGPQPPWPVDQAIAITGVADPDDDQLEGLTEAVAGLSPGYDILITGLRRGVELTAGELAQAAGVSVGVVLPFADPAARWPAPVLERFQRCVAAADWVVTLEGDPASPGKAVEHRNRWLWQSAVGAIVVGDDKLVDQLDDFGLGVVPIP